MLFVPLLALLVLVYHVLVLTDRHVRHKIALWVKHQYTAHPSKPDISSGPKGVRFREVPLYRCTFHFGRWCFNLFRNRRQHERMVPLVGVVPRV